MILGNVVENARQGTGKMCCSSSDELSKNVSKHH